MKEVKVITNRPLLFELQSIDISLISCALAEITSLWKSDIIAWPFTRIYCIKSGHAFLHTNDGDLEMTAGNIYIIPSEYPCGYSGDGDMYKLWLQLTVRRLDTQELFSKTKRILVLEDREALVDEIIDNFVNCDLANTMSLNALIHKIIAEGVKMTGLTKKDFPEYSILIKNAISLIERNGRIDYKADALAHDLGINTADLQRMFKHETGKPLGQFIKERIMYQASVTLKSSSRSVKEISYALGFANQFYFAKVFKAYFGISPTEYRSYYLS